VFVTRCKMACIEWLLRTGGVTGAMPWDLRRFAGHKYLNLENLQEERRGREDARFGLRPIHR